jgi:hypothetical protein
MLASVLLAASPRQLLTSWVFHTGDGFAVTASLF